MKTLLVIDMLNDFCRRDGALYVGPQVKKTVENVEKKLKEFKDDGCNMIFICDNHKENDREFKLFPPHCIEGSHGECIIEELEPQDGDQAEIMYKRTYSGCYDNVLLPMLCDEPTESVFVCGLLTSVCVMETVSDLYKEGITCNVLEDACCDIDKDAHDMAINRMRILFGAEII